MTGVQTCALPIYAHILNRYYKCTTVGCLLDWLDAGMSYDLEAEMQRLCALMDGEGKRVLHKAAER